MAKSYRKPYSFMCSYDPDDKRIARRCWRSAQNQALRSCRDFEEYIHPKKWQVRHQDHWNWSCDGWKSLVGVSRYMRTRLGLGDVEFYEKRLEKIERLKRK